MIIFQLEFSTRIQQVKIPTPTFGPEITLLNAWVKTLFYQPKSTLSFYWNGTGFIYTSGM